MESSTPQVIHNKRSFLATLALGLSGIVVVLTLCASGIFVYAMNIADRKTDNLFDFAGEIVDHVPQLRESLPPILGDAISDERDVSYQSELEVGVRVVPVRDPRLRRAPPGLQVSAVTGLQPVIEVKNKGDQVVSFLSMRIVLLDPQGIPIAETNEWAATPIADGGHSWRGPLFPGAKRSFRARAHYLDDARASLLDLADADGAGGVRAEVEITELRVWTPDLARERRVSAAVQTF